MSFFFIPLSVTSIDQPPQSFLHTQTTTLLRYTVHLFFRLQHFLLSSLICSNCFWRNQRSINKLGYGVGKLKFGEIYTFRVHFLFLSSFFYYFGYRLSKGFLFMGFIIITFLFYSYFFFLFYLFLCVRQLLSINVDLRAGWKIDGYIVWIWGNLGERRGLAIRPYLDMKNIIDIWIHTYFVL
ncbi:hypothetical protein DFH27DRAFT_212725 [Peziza echinospora]|nr:hypothetical protein DFH27DRAFT_212725 [Peziza echinospora]